MDKPYTQSELLKLALDGDPLKASRVLATFADQSNWRQVHEHGRCWWAMTGPTTPPYELVRQLEDGRSRV